MSEQVRPSAEVRESCAPGRRNCIAVRRRTWRHINLVVACLLAILIPAGCIYTEAPPEIQPPGAGPVEGKIEAPLARYMAAASGEDLIPVDIILRKQVSIEDKVRLFSQIHAEGRVERKRQQRQLLIAELKRVAQTSQLRVVTFLRSLEEQRQVRNINGLWISNVVAVDASKSVIERLTHFEEIERLHLDLPRPVLGEITSGVQQVNADDVWILGPTGYDGSGAVVAILDTGVDYNHTDLVNRMWINTAEDRAPLGIFTPTPAGDFNDSDPDNNCFRDDVVGWNFAGMGTALPYPFPIPYGFPCPATALPVNHPAKNPADVAGHGTHVAGIVAGDGSGGSRTGVAPGAKIMALRETRTDSLSTEKECWAGMQYGFDNGAHIVNFSSGWLDSPDPPDYATWRNAVQNLMDGGVLFVTISGNGGGSGVSPPTQVRTPGRVPVALTVGAVNSMDQRWPGSSIGPVTWKNFAPFGDYPHMPGPGLTKPDVVAPGVSIRTTKRGGGYELAGDSTSAAAPHAAGVAALLLDKNPGLFSYELKYLIEETAFRLPAGGMYPNSEYGWGRVDALNAINETINPASYDLSITETSDVWTSVDIWVDNDDNEATPPDTPRALSNNHLYARVRNLGGQVVPNVELKFYYADVSTIGISGFDPNGDGDPSDGIFTPIGSYSVPLLGPSGSDHDTAKGVVIWNIPIPTGDHWCVGVGVVAPVGLGGVLAEANTVNNRAFRNFFDIIVSSGGLSFKIAPPPKAPTRPFGLEILTQNLPDGATVDLVIDRALEGQLIVETDGLSRVDETLFTNDLGSAYNEALERSIPYVRYRLTGNRAVLREIVSRHGMSIPAKIVVNVPDDTLAEAERLVIVSTLDQEGQRVGGLTLNLVKGTPSQKGGPYVPKVVQ